MNWTYKHTKTVGITNPTSASVISGVDGWNAYGVELRWKSTDLTSAPVTTFVSIITSAVVKSTTTPTLESEEKSPGFSTGAKAGMGVSVALGVILGFLGIGFWILHRRKRRGKDGGKEPSELAETQSITLRHAIHELESNPVFEKDSVRGARSQSR
ncbi:hypothetical protein PEX1_030300 [Penicillium expansum]|uniref:Uncharacterized protein n=1 Tax=Penicillium expansum TaxID=27334 RepID=A0A0A2J636_PENEN|nr:hypothetical protein PEX2_013910 [Penicillium expansum]KGO36171.1 hypothetical protein PEX1_030300 [Penicillium expansum]KGO47850.1 hypothetical protein PEXP_015430 [Penicillium expansum]KGO61895.1 hypothetical protein PEX2_013910 [Penicillium expansum]